MDPLLPLETSSPEQACWLAAVEADRGVAREWLRRAEAIAAGYAHAAAAGRAEFAVCDVTCALQVDQLTASRVLAEALQLSALPQIAEAVETGALRLPHARALLDQLLPLEPAVACAVADEVLAKAADRTPSSLRAIARRAVLRADPAAAERRRASAVAERTMFLRPLDDGMTSLELHLRAETALRVYGAADEATRADDGTGRSADQRRVDWVVEQILAERATSSRVEGAGEDRRDDDADGAADSAARPAAGTGGGQDRRRRRPVQVQVVVPVAVALGISEEPCELVGYGPVSAEHGRELLADAELRKVCVDSLTGQVVAVDSDVVRPTASDVDADVDAALDADVDAGGAGDAGREQALAAAVRQALVTMVLRPSYAQDDPEPGYRPSAHLARTVRLRDVTCDFPFSSTPAGRCDLDHTRPHGRGQTVLDNLGSRSRRIHRAKQAGWTPRPLADGGLIWQSPSAASYRRPPPRERPPAIPPDAVLPPARPPRRQADPPPLLPEPSRPEPEPHADQGRSGIRDEAAGSAPRDDAPF